MNEITPGARGVGASTDVVRKEMYTFQDRSGRSLTLRPEGTAPVVRAFVEHEAEERGAELQRTLAMARAEASSLLAQEQRRKHKRGQADHSHILWPLLAAGLWLDRFRKVDSA